MADPKAFQLGPDGAVDDNETVVWDVMYTTGSSGAPTPFVSTAYDFLNILALNRNMLRLRGVTERDSILNLFPLTRYPHGAFVRVLHAAASCNIPVVSAMPGRADARRPELNNDDRRGGGHRGAGAADDPLGRAVLHSAADRARRGDRRPTSIRSARVRHRRRLWRGGAHRPDRAPQARSARRRHGSACPMARPRCRAAWSNAPTAPAITTRRRTSSCSRRSIRRPNSRCPTAARG